MNKVEWSDGAHEGISAEEAMRGAIGGEQPTTRLTSDQMRALLEGAPLTPDGYDDGANAAARLVLEFLERHPEALAMPSDSEYEWHGEDATLKIEGLYEYMKRVEPDWFAAHHENIWNELTGFMWGWAVNAARYVLSAPPVPNPALVVIGGKASHV